GDLAQRHFSGIRVVRSFAIEGFAESRFARSAMKLLEASLSLARIRGTMMPMLGATSSLGVLIVAWYGAHLLKVGPGGITKGDFFAFLSAWARMSWPMASAGMTIAVLQRGRVCFERLREIIDAEPDVIEPTTRAPQAEPRALRVDKLSYSTG